MNWLQGHWLYALPLLLPFGAVLALATWLHRRNVRAAFGAGLAERVLPKGVRRRRDLRDLLYLLGLAAMGVALAEPAFDKQIVQVRAEGVDLVLAIDLSRSMDATDVDPSRLERARREIQDLLDIVVGDRIGIVFFAGEAIGRLPLTEDYKAVRWVLGEADTSMFRAQGSDVAKAIQVSMELLQRDQGEAGKAVVIFSDGESHDPAAALAAAAAAEAEGIRIYTVPIGEATSSIPDGRGGVLKHQGVEVKSVPDFATLEEVASSTGGVSVKSVPSARDMETLYRTYIRTQVRAVERESQQAENWRSVYTWPLGLGLGFWLLGAWLGEGRRPFGAAAAGLLVLGTLSSPASASTVTEADRLYRAEDFQGAERAFEELALQRPSDADLQDRLAAARYRLKDYIGAAAAYERASELRGGDPQALYNAGNARYRAGELEASMARYDDALAMAPHEQAEGNKKLVEGELAARRQQKPPPPPKPEGGGEDENEGGGGEDSPEEPTDGSDEGEEKNGDGDGSDDPSDKEQDDGSKDPGDKPQDKSNDKPGDKPGEKNGDPSEGDQGSNPQDGPNGDPGDQQAQGGAAGEEAMGEASGNITPDQAGRMLDGVEEGRQRVQYVGREGAKPW